MLSSKKRKIHVPTETTKAESLTVEPPTPEATQPAKPTEQRPKAVKSLASEAAKGDGDQTNTNKERQERFKALQARAVGIPLMPS